jgi:catechol 2,3-dioxygenase-like lactoylglutathione lyase family enzyme
MNIKSVSGLTLYVKNLSKTAKFYEALGFKIRERVAEHVTAYSNWFWIDFVAAGITTRPQARPAGPGRKGGGVFIYLSVEDVDGFHKFLVAKGLKPVGKPQDEPSGNREFMVRDPDGFALVIFKRK